MHEEDAVIAAPVKRPDYSTVISGEHSLSRTRGSRDLVGSVEDFMC